MIKQCEACHIDFETEHDGKRFCSTRACKSDRRADEQERYYLKARASGARDVPVYGKAYQPKAHTRGPKPRKYSEEAQGQ